MRQTLRRRAAETGFGAPPYARALSRAKMRESISRSSLAFRELADGTVRAVLVVTLPGGQRLRFTADADPEVIAALMVRRMRARGVSGREIGFSLGSIWKAAKGAVKSVASSSVFKAASNILPAVAPALGPLAPAALATAGAMKGVRALTASKKLLSQGRKPEARQLVRYARKVVPRGLQPAVRAQSDRVYAMILRPV